MNFNNTMKSYRKYKYEISNNRDNKIVANLKKWFLLEFQSTVELFVAWNH